MSLFLFPARRFSLALILSVAVAAAAQDFAEVKKKADGGSAFAQYQIGYCYETGSAERPCDGVQQDYGKAAQWYQKAADQGHATAQYSLGLLYNKNLGVPQNYEKAYFWLSLAASAYSEKDGTLRPEVVAARDYAARHLTKKKLLEVQEQTARFLAKHPKSF
jgi:tetratricopeptide (TPR) repeat protein